MNKLRLSIFAATFALAACSSKPTEKGGTPVIIVDNNATNNGSVVTECGPGRSLCNQECIDTALDSENCGSCGQLCGAGTVCSQSQCQPVPDDCRTGGQCPAQYYCDEGTGLCAVGCSSNTDCPSGSFCELESHACLCTDAGTVVCGAECVAEGPLSCGTSCETCPPLSNGAATCVDGQCGQACDDGYMMCDGTCAACPSGAGVLSVACLGNQCVASECEAGHEICDGTCAACPATTGDESLGCDGAECIITDCPADTRLCNGSCAPCPDDPNGSTTCQGDTCVLLCGGGYHSCGDFCAFDGDTDNCGANCEFCSGDPNGSSTCESGSCGLSCDTDYRECAGGCAACPNSPGVVSTTCAGATCVVSTCAAGFQPCATGCCQPAPDGVAFDFTEVPSDVSIAVDSRGYPHLAFGSASANSAYYVYWDGSAWKDEFVRSGWAADIELDATDSPHLAIWGRSPDHLYYGARSASGWTIEQADDTPNQVGMTPDLEFDGSVPHILYYDISADSLRHAVKEGGTWNNGLIYSSGQVGFSPAFVIQNGDFHAVYRDETNNSTRYSYGDGNDWTHTILDDTRDSGNYSSLVANSAADIALAYVASSFQNGDEIYYTSRPQGGNWSLEVKVADGDRPSIVLDGAQSPVIVYYKPNGTGLRYVSASNGWSETTLDNASSVGEANHAVYDSTTGRVHVVYSDFANRDLKYLSFVP